MIANVPCFSAGFSPRRLVLALAATIALASAQDHPAFTPPAGFVAEPGGDASARVFVRKQANGDRLRLRVAPGAADAEPEALAKAAVDAADRLRDDTRQELATGALSGVAFSCLGASETVDGVPFTRYRRVMGFKLPGAAPFAVRADVLAKEPKPAQSTLEAMSRALADWQTALGGAATPPPDPEAPGSRPVLGGEVLVALKDGGDLEMRLPAAWGRADLALGDGRTASYFGPAREVLAALTTDSLAKDKDRLGPYVLVERIRRDTFKDLVDQQLLDIADSLLADYVAQQAEAGVTLKFGERDEGTLGTRVVVSVPFEESRKSGTAHRGRLVAMLHRGVLVFVTASHPTEGYDQGWQAFADALDTLVFTGAPEPDPAAQDGDPARPAAGPETPAAAPAKPADAADSGSPAPVRATPGVLKLAPAESSWLAENENGLRTARVPGPPAFSFAYPTEWALFGATSPTVGEYALVAAPDATAAVVLAGPRVRVEYRAFREELASADPAYRLMGLLQARLAAEGFAVENVDRRTVGGLPAALVNYAGGASPVVGAVLGVVADGTLLTVDHRFPAPTGNDAAARRTLDERLRAMAERVTFDAAVKTERRSAGPFSTEVPEGWTFDAEENRAGGRDIFLRAPSGLDLRFQTARQPKPELVTYDVLRKVGSGFLVDGLRVISARDFAAATRHDQPGARLGLRFQSPGPQLAALVTATLVGDQLVFALRGAPVDYRGRDLAIAWRVMRSFGPGENGFGPRPPRIDGVRFGERAVFTRTNLDDLSPEGPSCAPSSIYVAFLPDGSAGVVTTSAAGRRDLRGTYSIAGDAVTLDCPALGPPQTYRLVDGGETLAAGGPDAPVQLFRDRREETP